MTSALRGLFALIVFLALPAGFSHASGKPFFHGATASDAARYKAALIKRANPAGRGAAQWRQAGETARAGGDLAKAIAALEAAIATNETDGETWLTLARTLRDAAGTRSKARYTLMANASGAAFLAYKHAKGADAEAEALALLAELLAERSYWRPSLNAYKASLARRDVKSVRAAYRVLRAERGFRIIDYSVASDAAMPRLCVQFSEPLARAEIDFAKFITVDGRDPAAVRAEGRQLCIEGLKHGQRYEVLVRSGLPSAVAEALLKTARLVVYVRDRSPSVRFTGRNYVLPNRGQQGIPVVTVNTKKIAIQVFRIGDRALARTLVENEFGRGLGGWDMGRLKEKTGVDVWKGELAVRSDLNHDVTTAFPVSEAIGKLEPGVYVMVAEPGDGKKARSWEARATQWFIVSDLGLTAFSGADGVHAFVRSLESAEPQAGVEVRLVARNNEILGRAKTDERGHVHFAAGLSRGKDAMTPAVLVAEHAEGDYAFLDLGTSAFDLTDRGVAGRETAGPLEAHVFTERGVYRPGADVHVTALLRDRMANATAGVPLTLVVSRPDGVEHRRFSLADEGFGGRATTLALARSAMTGTWRVEAYADPKGDPIGETSFLVEDFVPERMDLALTAKTKLLHAGSSGLVHVKGRYLYGPPAAALALEGEIKITARKAGLEGYKGYRFGLSDDKVEPVRENLAGLPRTNDKGEADVSVPLPALPRASRLLKADIVLRLREPSGRVIERKLTLPIAPRQAMIGIKPLFEGTELASGENAGFHVVMVDPSGRQIARKGAKWTLFKITRIYQWYNRGGSWKFEAISTTNKIADGTIDLAANSPASLSVPVNWGRYRLEVSADATDGPVASTTFDAGWWGGDAANAPEFLETALDKASYKAGDTARLSIASETGGKALIAVVGEELHDIRLLDVPAGGRTVDIPVSEKWSPGAYVVAMLYRPMDIGNKRMPRRSVGIKWLKIDMTPHRIGVRLDIPEKLRSGKTLTIPVKLDNLDAGEEARLVIAAVDVGILNLTGYKPPAPDSWFYAQRRLGTEIRDLYGRLIDGMSAARGRIRSGGDAMGGMSMKGSPPTTKPVALFSGVVQVGADGTARVTFDLPEFNGTLKIMAVAWSKTKLGHGVRDLIVRDPVVLTVSAPRFLTLGDRTRLLVELHNVEGQAGSYSLDVTGEGGTAKRSGAIRLSPGARHVEAVPLEAKHVGRTRVTVHLTGPGGVDIERRVDLDIKPPARDIRRRSVQMLVARRGTITISRDLLADLIPERSKVTVSVGPAARLDVPGLLLALDRYPYGCAEQTTSKALPLLYLAQVSARTGIRSKADIAKRVQKAIDRLFEMQDESGGFGLWAPGSDMWLTAYVADFLTRAKEQNYKLPVRRFRQTLDRLQNHVAYASDFKSGGESIAYALYVLARNGRAPVGDLRYYADTRLDRFATPLAKAQIGAALAMYGDKDRAGRVFAAAMAAQEAQEAQEARRLYRHDYGSALRDGAALLTLVSETRSAPRITPRLTEVVAAARERMAHTSTQENAWLLLAAHALMKATKSTVLDVNGTAHKGALMRGLTAGALTQSPLKITNRGLAPVHAVITVTGAATTPEPPVANGYRIERTYYTLDGRQIELASAKGGATLKQNDRLVVVLKVEEREALGGRVLLVDRLPAGLEIENPRLVDSGDIKSLSWLKTTLRPAHLAFRDDRFEAAFDVRPGGPKKAPASFSVAYIVRAVTPGRFLHPPATVEDMYRPERFARTASGSLEVTEIR